MVIKAIGFGTVIAIAIDATLSRALVVPATMPLLDDLAWGAPRPLALRYRHLELGEAHQRAGAGRSGRRVGLGGI